MHLPHLLALATSIYTVSGTLTYTLNQSTNPSEDELDAYQKITDAMDLAIARYNRGAPQLQKSIRVSYSPGTPTADASFEGNIRFGANRSYMNERTALHETMHTLGVGTTQAWQRICPAQDFPTAIAKLEEYDGVGAVLHCDRQHFWPYGLNLDGEFSEEKAERHVQMVAALVADGVDGGGGAIAGAERA